ncbi:hypothetical protein [Alkalihalobacterium bogoriense]|uniref:hypothetical protein n=1 Tax=Alkalihalobacterium bogoriense TaxID=246272 RepID=UPI00047B65BE|nr:hypothetical protein [Alkalihalobacterium bogoriense]
MKKRTIGIALFIGFFVGVVVFLSEYLIPNQSRMVTGGIAGISALVVGLLGLTLFPNKSK